MRQRRILAATAAAVLGTVALPVLGVPTAQASTSVVVYACGMAGNWQCPAVRPSEVGFGALWDASSRMPSSPHPGITRCASGTAATTGQSDGGKPDGSR
jgi:hypothetical protein